MKCEVPEPAIMLAADYDYGYTTGTGEEYGNEDGW